jgi:hypothetical protein
MIPNNGAELDSSVVAASASASKSAAAAVVLLAAVVVAAAVLVVGQAPSPGRQSVGPMQALPFLAAGTSAL